jgi:hypothetical protein
LALTKVTTGTIADDSIQSLKNRNLIINGAMQVAQRGTSFSAGGAVYTLDRWLVFRSAASQSTDVPTGEGLVNSIQLTITSQTSGQFASVEQKFENEKLVVGRQLTFSFWIKGSTTGTAVVRNFSQSNSIGFGHTAFDITTSWQRVTATFTVPSLGGGTSNWCSFGIDFNVNNVAGLSYSGSGVSEPSYTGTVYLTGVQLEVGDVATPFEHESYGETLAKCQRYYTEVTSASSGGYIFGPSPGMAWNSTSISGSQIIFPVEMRTAPSFTQSVGTPQLYSPYRGAFNATFNLSTTFNKGVVITTSGSSGLIQDSMYWLIEGSSAVARLKFDAEL